MQKSIEEILDAVSGELSQINKDIVQLILRLIETHTKEIETLEQTVIRELKKCEKVKQNIRLMTTIPGFSEKSAQLLMSMIGPDFVENFPRHTLLLVGWAYAREITNRPDKSKAEGLLMGKG